MVGIRPETSQVPREPARAYTREKQMKQNAGVTFIHGLAFPVVQTSLCNCTSITGGTVRERQWQFF